ncbi:peptidyl-prolyl isomerase E (cyclophilin E), partial [Trypanosoma cruzi]
NKRCCRPPWHGHPTAAQAMLSTSMAQPSPQQQQAMLSTSMARPSPQQQQAMLSTSMARPSPQQQQAMLSTSMARPSPQQQQEMMANTPTQAHPVRFVLQQASRVPEALSPKNQHSTGAGNRLPKQRQDLRSKTQFG